MPINTQTGVYTPVAGSESATAGQTIASATWNAINTDYQAALTTIGNIVFAQNDVVRFVTRAVSVSTANTDVAVSIPVSALPGTPSTYCFINVFIANATANASAATVGVFTAAGATGTAVVAASTAITVTGITPGAANSMQFFTIANNLNTTVMSNTNPIFFRTMTGTAAAKVDLFVEVRPL